MNKICFAALAFVLTLGATAQTAPSITTQPAGQTLPVAGSLSLSVAVAGTGPFSYQWRRNGSNIANNLITTVAGDGEAGYSGDGGPATKAALNYPFGAAVAASGDLFIVDQENNLIRKVSAAGIISTLAGFGYAAYYGDGLQATNALLWGPAGVAVDSFGRIFIADQSNQRIRKVDVNGIITTVAGSGDQGFLGDGGLATVASLNEPVAVAVDSAGNLFIADINNNRVRKVTPIGVITTVVGSEAQGFAGDGGPATSARLNSPSCVVVDAAGNLFISDDNNNRIRKVGTNGIITTVAGGGSSFIDGIAATKAILNDPVGVAVDPLGDIFIPERGSQRVRKVDANGIISTVAGNQSFGFSGDGGAAASASFEYPSGVSLDAAGNLYITDRNNNRIREVALGGFPTLTVRAVTAANEGAYQVIVSNQFGSVTSAVAQVTVALAALNLRLAGASGALLTSTGAPGASYVLQTATNLAAPAVWRRIFTNTTDSLGNWSFTNSTVPAEPAIFYRLSMP